MPNVPLSQGIGASGSPRCQEAMGGSITHTRSERVPTQSNDPPLPKFNILGSDKGNLRQTKKVYGAAYTKLIMKVKKLEKTVKSNQARRRVKIVVSDDEEDSEDSFKQGRMIEYIDQDAGITLVTPTKVSSQEDQLEDQLGVLSAAKVLADATKKNVNTYTRRKRAVSTGSGGVSTASRLFSTTEESVSTTGVINASCTAGMVIEEEWENIRARVKADEVLSRRLQAEERNKYNEVDQAKMLVDLINQRKKYFDVQKAKNLENIGRSSGFVIIQKHCQFFVDIVESLLIGKDLDEAIGVVRPMRFLMSKDPEEEPIENEPLMEPMEEG
ncbi:hypothetical protein Tco_0216537 [Tanacetum coccineum]